jgi:voltage-gated potassium channel
MKKKKTAKKHTTLLSSDIFDSPKHPAFRFVNHFLAVTTLVSVAVVALETVASLAPYQPLFKGLEYIAVVIFTLEYIARIAWAKKPFTYIFSFFGIIDLVAIVPTYLGLSNLTFLKATRIVRIIRLLRMIRIAKFAEIENKEKAASSLYSLNLTIYFVAITAVTLILGACFYIFEEQTAADIPAGMYWALRVILGGISYPQPETIGGLITLIMARFTSMILLGMMLSLVGTMLRKALIGAEKDS